MTFRMMPLFVEKILYDNKTFYKKNPGIVPKNVEKKNCGILKVP